MIKTSTKLLRKRIPVSSIIVLLYIFISIPTAATNLDEKLFLYSSELPVPLLKYTKEFRKQVIDVILATQKYEVVFSKIPDILAKSHKKQKILKYKLRTTNQRYNLEYTLIDADEVQIIKSETYTGLSRNNLIYLFRLHLYEFILDKKLSPDILKKQIRKSISRAPKISPKLLKNLRPNSSSPIAQEVNDELQMSRATKRVNTPPKNARNKTSAKKTDPKKSLWALLKDDDRDITWLQRNFKTQESKNKKALKEEKEKKVTTIDSQIGINPFMNIGSISLKGDDEFTQDISTDQIHFAWKFVQRKQDIEDIISLENTFNSTLSFIIETIFYNPIHHSKVFYRLGLEYDAALNTEPIDMEDHLLLRAGFGYRLNYRLIPSFYLERSNLNYANLNTIGGGIESNTHSIYWANSEIAFLLPKNYLSLHFAKSIYGTKNGDTRENSAPSGIRVGANLRHYFQAKIWALKLWTGLEYRYSKFSRKNSTINDLSIKKSEATLYFGIYF